MVKFYQVSIIVLLLLLLAMFTMPKYLLSVLLPDQTIYANNRVKEEWDALRVGMSREEVLRLVGSPLEDAEYGTVEIYRIIYFSDGVKSRECYPNVRKTPQQYDQTAIQFHWLMFSKPGKLVDDYNVRMIKLDRDARVAEIITSRYSN